MTNNACTLKQLGLRPQNYEKQVANSCKLSRTTLRVQSARDLGLFAGMEIDLNSRKQTSLRENNNTWAPNPDVSSTHKSRLNNLKEYYPVKFFIINGLTKGLKISFQGPLNVQSLDFPLLYATT